MNKKSPRLHSLRERAIFFSAAISILIVLISIFGYSNFKNIHAESSNNLLKRDELLIKFNLIRSELLDSYKEMNNFLLEPENINYQKSIIVSIKEAWRISKKLNEHEWIIKYQKQELASNLVKKLRRLEVQASELIKTRLNVNNQFPSLAVGAEIMQPNRNMLNNAIALSINEMNTDNTQTKKPEVYRLLINIRHIWSQALSNSRLYLANRVGSFNEAALPIQEKAIETLFTELNIYLLELKKHADAGNLGFETTDAVATMIDSSTAWFNGFQKVKIINHSYEWRQDAKIMKEKISPTIDSVLELLVELEDIITISSKDDVSLVASTADIQNKILWLIAFIGVFFTFTVIFSLDKLIFKPIEIVSKALKFEALGKQTEDLPVVRTKETEDLVNAFNEMSRQVHLRQTELEYRALHDSLTSLPNRTLLLNRIEHDISVSKREGHSLSLLILDLDDFKDVNDTLGHIAGDNLLIQVGIRIKNILREVDTVARIGGDEFSILLPHTNDNHAVSTSNRILSALKKPINVEGIDVSVSASIGIAMYPEHGIDVHTLLQHADIAMYAAKRHKTGFEMYDENQDEHSISRLAMTKNFRDAVENNKLDVYFQPVFDMENTIVSVEALSRWYHPEHGHVSPEKFISLAEQSSLITQLTLVVLNQSIKQVSYWRKFNDSLCVSINLSVYSFNDQDFIGDVRSALKKYDFPANQLKLEITESAMMENPLQVIDMLSQLHEMGIKLSIDDYGTGFSSMSYIKQLPVDELKIDKSFVIGLEEDESNDAIVRSTIELAHNLNLKVVAEGIETEGVYKLLKEYHCDMAQGFYLSRPLPAEGVEALLKTI